MDKAKGIKNIFYFLLGLSIFISGEVIGSEKDFKKLQLTGNCPDCSLANADLSNSNLSGAYLEGADLYRANLETDSIKRII